MSTASCCCISIDKGRYKAPKLMARCASIGIVRMASTAKMGFMRISATAEPMSRTTPFASPRTDRPVSMRSLSTSCIDRDKS